MPNIKRLIMFLPFTLLSLILLFFFQNCTSANMLQITELSLNANGGHGDGYEGKLTFVHLEPNFTCEGKIAPKSILRRDELGTWYFASNTEDHCAISQQGVDTVNFSLLSQIVTFGAEEYVLTLFSSWENISLAGEKIQFPISVGSVQPINCPANYALVTARLSYTQKSFCVAKFEMKIQGSSDGSLAYDSVFVAQSGPDGTPWTNIDRDRALSECQGLGFGYDLISNAQWQSIAQNAELQSRNWTSGAIGVSTLFRGHTDNSPANSVSITDSSDPYNLTGNNSGQADGSGREQRRTMDLASGESVWDLSGNVYEWIKDDNSNSFGTDGFISQITLLSHPFTASIGGITGNTKFFFGPFGDYPQLGSSLYGGFGYAWIQTSGGAITRGGDFNNGNWAGIFSLRLNVPASTADTGQGFRCVYNP
jgi:formylglycine-generating enzyme required for sulfatase activity